MSLLQKSVDALTAAAGWKMASPGADGVFRFRLEGDLDMEFFSPDGRTGILRADLGPLPAAEQDADDLLRKCASRMVAASRSRRTVLSSTKSVSSTMRQERLKTLRGFRRSTTCFLLQRPYRSTQLSLARIPNTQST